MSNKIRFIGDLHFSHLNMAIKRGFKDEKEHDEFIIDKWNSVVNKNDTTWILGDLTMEKKTPYHLIDRLKGIKKVVLGNHDHHSKDLLSHVNSVFGSIKYEGFIITHIPIHESEIGRFRGNIHAHTHENSIGGKYICCSCEQINYTPKTLEELLDISKFIL